ncbi:IP17340p [Strongyloides ratti]|uniref:IP17340p n=1 Tax=Strongyloides ratti TaxID=34506 RepID=A0A090LFM6_STRRB|nr:IP17340p [Strongyloides ratti]CEF68567.1 IP17340p [Strongyloides ratti]
MFAGKANSLRHALYKRHKSDSSSSGSSSKNSNSLAPAPILEDVEKHDNFMILRKPSATKSPRGRVKSSTDTSQKDSYLSTINIETSCTCGDFFPQIKQKKSTPVYSQLSLICPLHENPLHFRSNSASPHIFNSQNFLSGPVSPRNPTNTSVPILIPLRSNSARSGTSSSLSYSNRNLFIATRLDSSSVYDFEDWNDALESPHMHVENSPGISSTSYHMGLTEINKIIFENQDAVYSLFMKAHKCYDVIPTSSKLVILDIELPVKKAFFALIYNGVRAAPLYDSKKQEFVGMLTITDFISILVKYYNKDSTHEGIKELEEQKIVEWREQFKEDGNLKKFITIDPQESLYKAVQMLCEEKIHRLPVLNSGTGNVNYILTHKRLIKFLNLYLNDLPKPTFMDKTPKELGIGCWENVISISINTPLVEALKIFLEKRVSALPLVDDDGKVVDIYAKFDAINLCSDKAYINLDITVSDALSHRNDLFEGVKTFRTTDSLINIVQILVESQVHRLVAVDDEDKILGIVSLSDILRYLILDVPNSSKNKSSTDNKSTINNTNDDSTVNIDENGVSCISIHNTTTR